MDFEKLALKHALKNALKHDGKAVMQAVITASITESPKIKKNIKQYIPFVKKAIEEVNSKSKEEQLELFKSLFPNEPLFLEKKERTQKEIFMDLLGIKDGDVINTAFPPEPSKYPHLGHIKGIVLNHDLAKTFNGSFTIRFEDSNHEKVKQEYYDAMFETLEWLGIKPDKVVYLSKELETLYRYAEQLIRKGLAYVCSCSVEEVRNSRRTGISCSHRDQSIEENLKKWREMFNAPAGSMILRAKIDLKHKNTTMRDPTLFRIMDVNHPIVGDKYRVWPSYDFATAVLDGVENITFRFRSKEFEMRTELHNFFQRELGLTITKYYHYARFNIEGVPSSGRIIREKIMNKELIGWDDPILTTVLSFKKRGFQPEAIKDFVRHTGFSKNEGLFTWSDLYAFNRRILDKKAKRFFFIANPVKIVIKNAPNLSVKVRRHPDIDLGERTFNTSTEFWIAMDDFKQMKNGLYRFMELLNFEYRDGEFFFHSLSYEDFKKNNGLKIIHWLPVGYETDAEVLMPDKSLVKGFIENYATQLNLFEVIQAERFGFMCLNEKNEKLRFWYTHK